MTTCHACQVQAFHDRATGSFSYIVADPETRRAAVLDPVLDFEPNSGRTSTVSADRLVAAVEDARWTVDWILDTHVHADHLSASHVLQGRLGGKTGIGKGVVEVQNMFGDLFNAERGFPTDGSQFDKLWEDGEAFMVGSLEGQVLAVPGHTPACVAYVFGHAVFVGDTMFMPDSGTARADFPGGSAALLYDSIQRILALDPVTRLFVCHDYGAGGERDVAFETSVGEQRRSNIHVRNGIGRDRFVSIRERRDATLSLPALMLAAVQVNMRGGRLPPPDANGIVYLKWPVNVF